MVNEYRLLMSNAGTLYDDGNFVLSSNTNVVVWETNTHDKVHPSDSNPVRYDPRGNIAISRNGRYLLWVDKEIRRWSLHDMTFNSPILARFVKRVYTQFTLAFDANRAFCWDHLRIGTGIEFVDPRCTCLSDPRLFDIVVDPSIPNREIMRDRLPCIMADCVVANASREVTVAGMYHKEKCQNIDITMCNILIDATNSNMTTSMIQKETLPFGIDRIDLHRSPSFVSNWRVHLEKVHHKVH